MRALVIGFPLPNPQIDNYNLLTSPSWFDYDGVVVEPLSISQVIADVLGQREEHRTRADQPVLNRPTSPLNVGLADAIKRRRAEVVHLLAAGGTIVVFAQPNVVHEGVTGFAGCDRYAFLPAPAGISYEAPFMLRAEGTELRVADSTHPFAPVLEKNARWLAYRARFDETVPGFSGCGHVFARSVGGAAVGVELRVGAGRVIFLPAFGSLAFGDQRFELATAMLEALRLATGKGVVATPPAWVRDISLPGAEELEQAEREAAEALEAAQTRLSDARAELEKLTKYRALLWQEGSLGLEPVVRDALRTLGFEIESDPDKPGWIADGSVKALFEVEGAADAVLEYPYFRLQKRLEKDLLATKAPKHGLIVANGQRELPPGERIAPVSDTLRIAAENYRYALLTTERLLDMVRSVLEQPFDPVRRSIMRARLLGSVGEVGAGVIPTEAELK